MKLILSRKGFDSSAGGGPSPRLPDGTLLSLPIPSSDEQRFTTVRGPDGKPLARLMRQLGLRAASGCHLDPDLDRNSVARTTGWRPAFGSIGAAGSHLLDQGVGPGDLFLFFGWFRDTRLDGRRLRFVPRTDRHWLFGYLQVGERFEPDSIGALPPWLHGHPHARPERLGRAGNVLFAAAAELDLDGAPPGLPGAGLLSSRGDRVLTAPGMSRSRWALPRALFGGLDITYHSERSWRDGYFQSAFRGQEFVLTPTAGVRRWALERIIGPG
ncbi:MAG: hypothetical protein AAGE01_12645 [Pseudomonadota bacterium]